LQKDGLNKKDALIKDMAVENNQKSAFEHEKYLISINEYDRKINE
jgi:hypothetical protein